MFDNMLHQITIVRRHGSLCIATKIFNHTINSQNTILNENLGLFQNFCQLDYITFRIFEVEA